jgi:hypothetical protein
MEKINIKIYDSNYTTFTSILVTNKNTIKNIKKKFSKNKNIKVKNIIAYDSFNISFNNNIPLDNKTTFQMLFEKGFSKENDYIIIKY